jgi:nickel-dependent lactate racemase
MRTRLAYGKTGLEVSLDDSWNVQVVAPRYVPGLPDPLGSLTAALRAPVQSLPLAELARPGQRVGIIVNDITRATPTPIMLQALLAELGHIPPQDITVFIALGTHRPNTGAELRQMLGAEVADGHRVVQNDAFDKETQVCLGQTQLGHPIWINRELAACEVKVLTGFIEPHLFAGFSGGGKAIMPGMAGQETVLGNHSAANIAHPQATWGQTQGNPIWEEIQEIAERAGASLLLNVALNSDKEITGVFAGELRAAHEVGCAFVRQTAMTPVAEAFDIVVTTNSGYPLDLNLYQSVKGMSAASLIVREGGAIVVAAECWDGIPAHGRYGQLLREAGSPQAVLERLAQPGFCEQDQWQAQIQAQIQLKAEVYVVSTGLTPEAIEQALLIPAASVETALARLVGRYGPAARICLLPEGPQTIPFVLNGV